MTEMRIRSNKMLITFTTLCVVLLFCAATYSNCHIPEYLQKYIRNEELPTIYAITPTYARPAQKAELTRLSHVILLSPNVHWIIVEDANQSSALVRNLIHSSGLYDRATLLYSKTPDQFKLKGKDPNWVKPRGVEQRNVALQWIRSKGNAQGNQKHSLVYFMDDDNTYSVELFREISKIQPGRVGVWPVGLVGGLMVEKPLLDSSNTVVGFNSVWRPERPFPVDMAGFSISTNLLLERPEAVFSYDVQRGYQESEILRHLTTLKYLQPMANLCKEVLVWHTRTEKPKLTEEEKLLKKGKRSDEGMEV